jgi:alkanesulfonate monooxygenase
MAFELTFKPTADTVGEGSDLESFFYDHEKAAKVLAEIEDFGFHRIVIDDVGGILANIELAELALAHTRLAKMDMVHAAGLLSPAQAASDFGRLQQIGRGRLELSMASSDTFSGSRNGLPASSHVERVALVGRYVEEMRNNWALEGSFPSLRLSGLSGAAIQLAARHADVFVLPETTRDVVENVISRLRTAEGDFGRARQVRLALPVNAAGSQAGWQWPLARLDLLEELGIEELVFRGPGNPALLAKLANLLSGFRAPDARNEKGAPGPLHPSTLN